MNYPEFLKKGDYIGICAPSDGITKPFKIKKLEAAKEQLIEMGYHVIETESVRKSEKGKSASAEVRAKEFMQLLEDDRIKLIIFAAGGDFLCEMLDYLDFDKIKMLKSKWMQGYSNITSIGFLFNTILEIPTIYCQSIKDYAMRPLHKSLTDALAIESGNEIIQESFAYYEKDWNESNDDPSEPYHLTEKVEWKNITGEPKIIMQGRALGGCLDDIVNYIGTKYDNVKTYIQNHKNEGTIWFLECYEMSTSQLFRTLWQMKNAGYFENCNGIIFGRPLYIREEFENTFNGTVKEVLGNLNIPIICDADIGHVSPQMAILNGGFLKITSENGKGKVENYFR